MELGGLSGLSGLRGGVLGGVFDPDWTLIPSVLPQYYNQLNSALEASGNAGLVFDALVNSVGWLDASTGYPNAIADRWVALRGNDAIGASPVSQSSNYLVFDGKTWKWNVANPAWGMVIGRRSGMEQAFSSILSSRAINAASVPNTPGGEIHSNFSAAVGLSMDQINTPNERINNVVVASKWNQVFPYPTNKDFIMSNVFPAQNILYTMIGADSIQSSIRKSTGTRTYGFFFLSFVPSDELRDALHVFFRNYYNLTIG